ncbi:outer membrane lipoprotein-sorting protein [Rhodohalobacter mucosus]|uniref:Outer membrane lipoprotein-sorting protein n=2 Tax=Rhodohalobacter mucosus TaxID=2079485 RepID=A0A316U3J2_9BACT|nr:outer membrane lipoprotein-sorting protein [Rhodohalobacter mucosus]
MGILLLILLPAGLIAQDASEIIERVDQVMRGESSYAEMTMTIERPRYTRKVSMRAWSLGDDYSLIKITEPARDEGTAYLKRENEIWNYVPNIDRTIKMPPSMMSQSWMGSDFTNDDLVRESSITEDYEHSILREDTLRGRESWVLELIPKPEAAVVYGKVLLWVDKEEYIQLRVKNYDQQGEPASTIELTDIREMGGRTLPAKMTLTPADKPDHKTVLEYREIEFNISPEQSFFSLQNMRRKL